MQRSLCLEMSSTSGSSPDKEIVRYSKQPWEYGHTCKPSSTMKENRVVFVEDQEMPGEFSRLLYAWNVLCGITLICCLWLQRHVFVFIFDPT